MATSGAAMPVSLTKILVRVSSTMGQVSLRTTSVRKIKTLFIRNGCLPSEADELGNWRPERNMSTAEYFQAYQSHIPVSEPEQDFDDRMLFTHFKEA
jgi:hypothetical protein